MGTPPAVLGFIEALYKDNIGVVCFGDCQNMEISIERGIRQGDPMSMVLFSLALDPIFSGIYFPNNTCTLTCSLPMRMTFASA